MIIVQMQLRFNRIPFYMDGLKKIVNCKWYSEFLNKLFIFYNTIICEENYINNI